MEIKEFLAAAEFRRLLDEDLRRHAHKAAQRVIKELQDENCRLVQRSQIQSIPSVIQASGVAGLVTLADKQKAKNTKKENKFFWTFLSDHLTNSQGDASLTSYVAQLLREKGITQDPDMIADKARQGQVKKQNRVVSQEFMEAIGTVYFEHFVCEYCYQCQTLGQEDRNGR